MNKDKSKLKEEYDRLRMLYDTIKQEYYEKGKELKEVADELNRVYEELEGKEYNMSDISICVYDNNQIGFFKRDTWCGDREYFNGEAWYNAGEIYTGLDNGLVGLKRTHFANMWIEEYAKSGKILKLNKGTFEANISLKLAISFNDMQYMMRSKEGIKPYLKYGATEEEQEAVLEFAKKYYGIDDGMKLQKTNNVEENE